MAVAHYFRAPAYSKSHLRYLSLKLSNALELPEGTICITATEYCFYVGFEGSAIDYESKLRWLLASDFDDNSSFGKSSLLRGNTLSNGLHVEIGPRLNFTTPFSTNCVAVCLAAGIEGISRVERSIVYQVEFSDLFVLNDLQQAKIIESLHDPMTECHYKSPIASFHLVRPVCPYTEVDVFGGGIAALRTLNQRLGLALDEWDLNYYLDVFANKLKKNPTDVELFDLAQSNSEHSRHWFFRGHLLIDGQLEKQTLFDMIMNTQKYSNNNNVIKFCDNSSGVQGFNVSALIQNSCSSASPFHKETRLRHIIYTAETHNFPTGVCPFPGAATGTGGRIRDVQAAGRGAYPIAGISAYSFGNLNIPGYELPWEDKTLVYPKNFAKPLDIIIQASNGASDYGNKFGEPVICGFARSFGLNIPRFGQLNRIEWIKPIMFSGGVGTIEHSLLTKDKPEKGMLVVKLGGPVYRIGVGGGAASSVEVQGESSRHEELDFGAVQRGDPEMEQKLNKTIRSCAELNADANPILSIHDQGAGGNGNVLKEIVEGAGAIIYADRFELGDPTISILELWGAEYQESNAILIRPDSEQLLKKICKREQCPINIVGTVTGDNKVVLTDFRDQGKLNRKPVDLKLDDVLVKIPKKEFHLKRCSNPLPSFALPSSLSLIDALDRVLRLPSVASKRYLTNKVDRSVTGLIAQQQCVGPLHTPLADVAVTALSYYDTVGAAVAVGEQPIKGLINPECGARMSVGESLTNIVFSAITELRDVKCSGNWMWPAKLEGEGAELVDACSAMCSVMKDLGVAVDGGKDSLSMAARVNNDVVKSPGTLVISSYAPCIDIRLTVTPDLKCPDNRGCLLYIRFGSDISCNRLGGSALLQCYSQIGNDSPDLDCPKCFVNAFGITQRLVRDGLLTAGHDVSDGGLITCILEMAFAGNCGLDLHFPTLSKDQLHETCFAEELGIVVETSAEKLQIVKDCYGSAGVSCFAIGHSVYEVGPQAKVILRCGENVVLSGSMVELRDTWEATSFALEQHQCNPVCVQQERKVMKNFVVPPYQFDWTTIFSNVTIDDRISGAPTVAVVREQGSNGDREMAAAFHMAGFDTWDVNMTDFIDGNVTLQPFRGLAFVGGFSFADVLGSAKGWAGAIRFRPDIKQQFDVFYKRPDTFTFGVCNGCQLMALLGWVGSGSVGDSGVETDVFLDHNESGRFESRFCTVSVTDSPSIMLKGLSGSVLGVWVSHGEGRFTYKSDGVLSELMNKNLIPLRYVDDKGIPTETYPLNPNGSKGGVAGICSADGRHLALMPHPERCFLNWQWPYFPCDWQKHSKHMYSPWYQIFVNAFNWCSSSY